MILGERHTYFDYLLEFLIRPNHSNSYDNEVDPVLSGYWQKTLNSMLSYRFNQFANMIFTREDICSALVC